MMREDVYLQSIVFENFKKKSPSTVSIVTLHAQCDRVNSIGFVILNTFLRVLQGYISLYFQFEFKNGSHLWSNRIDDNS